MRKPRFGGAFVLKKRWLEASQSFARDGDVLGVALNADTFTAEHGGGVT